MSSRLWALLVFSVIAIAVALTLYFVDWAERTSRGQPSWDALVNEYLASERFLGRLGKELIRQSDAALLDDLPDGEVIVLERGGPLLRGERLDGLIQWVASGGRLIARADAVWDEEEQSSRDALLNYLGVQVHELSAADRIRDAVEASVDEEAGQDEEVVDLTPPASLGGYFESLWECGSEGLVDMNMAGERVAVAMPGGRSMSYLGDELVDYGENEFGIQYLEIYLGSGSIVMLTSFDMWHNFSLGCHDHAHALRMVLGSAPIINWVANTSMPSLWEQLYRSFYLAVLLLGAALVAWLWHHSIRTQRPKGMIEPARREVMEHLEGVARFLWQQKHVDSLLKALRRKPMMLMGVMSIEQLAEECGLSTSVVSAALTSNPSSRTDEFRDIVRVLVRLNRLSIR